MSIFDNMNAVCADVFCDQKAVWTSTLGAVDIDIAITVSPAYDENGFQVAGEAITGGCLYASVSTLQRNDTITVGAVIYSALALQHDGAGWATIILEKQ